MTNLVFILFICALQLCYGHENATSHLMQFNVTERIGNFSLELLYQTSVVQQQSGNINMIMSPITLWATLAALTEGTSEETNRELRFALRIAQNKRQKIGMKSEFVDRAKRLKVHTNTIEFSKMNTILLNSNSLPLQDFVDKAKFFSEIDVYSVNFTDSNKTSELINRLSYVITTGRVPTIVEKSYFDNAHVILASALYFKGQWSMPFNASSTARAPFYSSTGEKIGEVNMMYSKNTYPLSQIKKLQARVIELPYGDENRFSMFIMLPNRGVSLQDMFYKFINVTLDELYEELRICGEVFGDDKVDTFIPRFEIDSNLELTAPFKRLGLHTLFDPENSRLPYVARTPAYVSKVLHRVKIEVTEDGIESSNNNDVNNNSNNNDIGTVKFEANRPFVFFIVEKLTNSILFGGNYQNPTIF